MHDAQNFWGLDPEYARDASGRMESSAVELGSMVNQISGLLQSVTWEGPGARRFTQDWSGAVAPDLRAATESLSQNAAELRRRADMQDEVSR